MTRARWTDLVPVWAFAVFFTFLVQFVVLILALSPRPPLTYFINASIIAAAMAIAIPTVHGPAILALKRFRPGISGLYCGVLGAALFPVPQAMLVLLLSERTDTWQSMLAAVIRLPGEVFLSGGPLAFGGFVFGLALAQPVSRRAV